MKGNVLGFDADTNTGAISGYDGRRYDFVRLGWQNQRPPQHGDVVDFVADGQRATRIYLLSPEYVAPGIGQFYFSARGRISRAQYWLRFFLPVLLISLVLDGIAAADKSLRFLPEVFQLLVLWPGIAVLIKRIHDRNKSGWLVWLLYVPLLLAAGFMIAGVIAYSAGGHGTAFALGAVAAVFGVGSFVIAIWFFVEFGCMRGTVGANPYGADPVVR